MTKASKVRESSVEDLTHKLNDLRMELLKLRFQSTTGQVKNPVRKRMIRKDIARILTVIKEKKNAR